jgi:hypothetical protein
MGTLLYIEVQPGNTPYKHGSMEILPIHVWPNENIPYRCEVPWGNTGIVQWKHLLCMQSNSYILTSIIQWEHSFHVKLLRQQQTSNGLL